MDLTKKLTVSDIEWKIQERMELLESVGADVQLHELNGEKYHS